MDLEKQFNEILSKNTRNRFHDSSLIELKIKPEEKMIIIEIEHWKDGDKEGEEKIFLSKFLFDDVSNIQLNNQVNCFGEDDEITSFNISITNNFILTGSKGWVLSFSSSSFEYNEKLKKIYVYD